MVDATQARITAEEFAELVEQTDERLELIDGEIIVMPTHIPDHQDVVLDTAVFLKAVAKMQGGKVYVAPMEVYFDDENIPQPDVMYLALKSRCVVGKTRLEGAPELIVEVFSPGTLHHDKRRKFELYQKYAVQEYWMIDPTERYIDVFRYVENRFDFYGSFIPGDKFTSPVLNNQEVNVAALFGGQTYSSTCL